MKFIGNIVWLILGGMVIALVYYILGLLFCLTIIGIPFGFQLFKFGTFSLWPFGTQVIEGKDSIGCTTLLYEHTMDYIGLVGNCTNAPIFWIYTLYYDNRHTFRDAAFQDGRTIIAAFWQDVQIVNAMSK